MTSAFHDTGIERFHHPIVGARPSFDDETVRRRLTMAVYVAEPGSPSHGALNLLVGWEVTLEQAEAANAVARL